MPFLLQGAEKWLPQSFLPSGKCPVAHGSLASPSPEPKPQTFEKLRPIMARLPSESGSDEEEEPQDFSQDYYRPREGLSIPGTIELAEEQKSVVYTRARLPDIDADSKDLWAALHSLMPVTNSYAADFQCRVRFHKRDNSAAERAAVCPMEKGSSPSALELVRKVFNWDELCLSEETEGNFYGVVFQSKRAQESDVMTETLMAADKLSNEEAVNAGGLLMYWYGVPDPATGLNLATCIWSSRDKARAASDLPLHRVAAKHAARAYEDFRLSRYKVVKLAGETGVHIQEWDL